MARNIQTAKSSERVAVQDEQPYFNLNLNHVSYKRIPGYNMNQTAGEFRRRRSTENRAIYNNTPEGIVFRSQTVPCFAQTFHKFHQSNLVFTKTSANART